MSAFSSIFKYLLVVAAAMWLGAAFHSLSFPRPHASIPRLDGDLWFNSKPLLPSDLKGKVVLIDFWDYTCVNCLRTLPYMRAWNKRYRHDGLVIIGVHTPEFEFAKNPVNVKSAVVSLGIKYPVVMDDEYKIWREFNNHYWPAKYLFDAEGRLRDTHFGEGDYQATETKIQELLREIHPGKKFPKPLEGLTREDKPGAVCRPMTPELYVGPWRGELGNREGYHTGEEVDYHDPGNHKDGVVYANGRWQNESQALRDAGDAAGRNDYIALKYHAIEVNAVIKPEGAKNFRVYVSQDGKPVPPLDKGLDVQYDPQGRSYIEVKEPRMYRVIENDRYGSHELRLASDSSGFALYSFTFGACDVPAGH